MKNVLFGISFFLVSSFSFTACVDDLGEDCQRCTFTYYDEDGNFESEEVETLCGDEIEENEGEITVNGRRVVCDCN